MTFPTLCVSFFSDLGVAAKTVCNLALRPVGWKWPDFQQAFACIPRYDGKFQMVASCYCMSQLLIKQSAGTNILLWK